MISTIVEQIQKLIVPNGKERCGVITEDGLVEITNVSNSNDTFVFSKRQWFGLLNSGVKIEAVWHTHSHGSPEPSEADLLNSKHDMLIVTVDDWRYIKCPET